MTETVHASYVLVSCILIVVVFTIQLFFVINPAAVKIAHGSQRDNGLYPKRAKNVNAWFVPTGGDNTQVTTAYPMTSVQDPNIVRRLQIAPTTQCPIFRAQDDGSTDPPLIA